MATQPPGDTNAWESLLQEVLLLAGGLPPLEALQAAILNPSMSMQATDSLGTVAGKRADLVCSTATC